MRVGTGACDADALASTSSSKSSSLYPDEPSSDPLRDILAPFLAAYPSTSHTALVTQWQLGHLV